ncbi:hypothetical protein XENOCAPTIV_001558 [Xenoophorus captivus]|uniref:Uncharacterized protein n=1 Tax=Xenoophorus captivus TaxID=1517983 RepID=A0ABV0REY4_9TELE
MRLGREVRTRLGLQKQVNCYLAALNCLRLIRPEYAWIVQPVVCISAVAGGRQVDILELHDLEKDYFLSRARLTLAQHHPPSAAIAGSVSAPELVLLLAQTGLFDSALSLSRIFKLDLSPLQSGGEEHQSEAWSWLAANQLSVVNTKESSATDEAWRLLASYLDRYPSTNGQHHRHVIHKLLSHGIPLPDWLLQSYKRPLSATSPPAWLPYTAIDQLLLALSETQTHSSVSHFLFTSRQFLFIRFTARVSLWKLCLFQLHNKVQDKLAEYHNVVQQTTDRRLGAQRQMAS